jgi:uncharacterized protein
LKHNHAIKLVFVAALICGCATTTGYYQSLSFYLNQNEFLAAAQFAEKSKETVYGQKDSLLYNLDEGMLLHLAQDYAKSSESFERAKRIYEDNFTKSITNQAATFLVSDNVRPYYGEDFERALVNVFEALNYVMLGQENEALVEARQANAFLSKLQTDYGYKNIYKEDAFVRYLMGMLYENRGEINDAYISYFKALEAYGDYVKKFGTSVPKVLVADAVRTASALGFNDEINTIEETWGIPDLQTDYEQDEGEVVLIHYNGPSPVKIDNIIEIGFGKAWAYVDVVQPQGQTEEDVEKARAIARSIVDTEQVRLAFPKYVSTKYVVEKTRAVLVGDDAGRVTQCNTGEVVDDIGAIAQKNLDDHIARIRIRTIARAAIKFALTHKISSSVEEKSGDKVLGWFVKKALTAASTATELADKRSWRTLPDKIEFLRLRAQKGIHDIRVEFFDQNNNSVEEKMLKGIKVIPCKKTFVILKTLR